MRPQDEVWDAIVQVCGADSSEMTKSERGRYNRAVKELKEAGATAEEIHKRARTYHKTWPNISLTPNALASNWSTLKAPPSLPTQQHQNIPSYQDPPCAHADPMCTDCRRANIARLRAAVESIGGMS